MLTDKERALFQRILDLNWEYKLLREESEEKARQLDEAKESLIEEMGFEAYQNFMKMGQRMFANKD